MGIGRKMGRMSRVSSGPFTTLTVSSRTTQDHRIRYRSRQYIDTMSDTRQNDAAPSGLLAKLANGLKLPSVFSTPVHHTPGRFRERLVTCTCFIPSTFLLAPS